MAALEVVGARDWYETIRMADDVTLVHEPWIKPFFRCNMWHVRGRDRDLLFDSGLGHFSLRGRVPLVTGRPLVCVASHTHFDHIGCHHEFPDRCVHPAEAGILADPRAEWTLADRYATDEMFDRFPEGWDSAGYRIPPAPAGRGSSTAMSLTSAAERSRSSTRRAIPPAASACSSARPASSFPATSFMTAR